MNKYRVKILHVFHEILEVEGETPEAAKQNAVKIIEDENHKNNLGYESTVPSEHWSVIAEEDFQKMLEDFKAQMANQGEPNNESNIITPSIITP
jgi:hypothetical protein